MKVTATLVVLAIIGVVHADDPKKYLNIYVGRSEGTKAAVPTGIPLYDNFVNLLSRNPHLTLNDVVASPIYVLIASIQEAGRMAQFYAQQGLNSILKEPSLKPVYDYLSSAGEKYGFIFRPGGYNDPALLKLAVGESYVPDDFKVGDLFKVVVGSQHIPFIILADKAFFDDLNLKSIDNLGRFDVSPSGIVKA